MNMQLLLFDANGMLILIEAIVSVCVDINPKTEQYDLIDYCLVSGIKGWCDGFHDLRKTPDIIPIEKAPYDLVKVSNLMRERQAYKRYLTEIEQRIKKCLTGEDDYVDLIHDILFHMEVVPFVKVEPWIKTCQYLPEIHYRLTRTVHRDDIFEPLKPSQDYKYVTS